MSAFPVDGVKADADPGQVFGRYRPKAAIRQARLGFAPFNGSFAVWVLTVSLANSPNPSTVIPSHQQIQPCGSQEGRCQVRLAEPARVHGCATGHAKSRTSHVLLALATQYSKRLS